MPAKSRLNATLAAAFLSAVAIFACASAAEDVAPQQIILDGRSVVVPKVPGFCTVDPTIPGMETVAASMERAFSEVRMLTFEMDCQWIEALPTPPPAVIPAYLAHLALLDTDGRAMTFPGTRAVFLDLVTSSLNSMAADQSLNQAEADAERRIGQVFDELNDLADTAIDLQGMAVRPGLGQDDAGTYLGAVFKLRLGERDVVFAGVSGITLIRSSAIGVSIYRPYEGPETFQRLLEETQTIMAALVVANDPEL